MEQKQNNQPKAKAKKKMNPAVKSRLISSLIFAAITAVLVLWARLAPATLFPIYTEFSRRILSVLASITAVLPFALWEWLTLVLVVWFFVSLALAIRKKRFGRWCSSVLMSVCLLVFLFVALWGLNHFGPKITEKMDIQVEEVSVEQLRAATEYYMNAANELSTQVPRDENGWFSPGDLVAQSEVAALSFRAMAEENSCFSGSTASVKPLYFSYLFGKIGITGIFVDFTGESCVSTKTYVCSQPFTVCHEMSHRLCFAAEDEANFVAYLACQRSQSMILRYSGAYQAFVYCYNALSRADAQAGKEIWERLTPQMQADCRNSHAHHDAVSSERATSIADAVNDAYLKAFSQESGTQSYGEVTDLLVAWYLKNRDAAGS